MSRKEGFIFVVRKEVTDAILRNEKYGKMLNECKTGIELENLFVEFCRKKGLKIGRVNH